MRGLAAAAALFTTGCATVLPLQTASTVAPGGYRVGGQLSMGAWCGTSGDPVNGCALPLPPGPAAPELRLSARRGLSDRFDLGASVRGLAAVGQVQAGLFIDGKGTAWRGEHALVSVGLGLGFTSSQPNVLSNSLEATGSAQLALPVYWGYQTEGWEWVVSPRVDEEIRSVFQGPDQSSARKLIPATYTGVAFAAFTRSAQPWAFGVELRLPAAAPLGGGLTLAVSKFWDL